MTTKTPTRDVTFRARSGGSVRTFHMVLDAGIDRFSDAKIRRDFLPMLAKRGAVTVEDVRRICREQRAAGFEVFPSCDNHDARGICLGHDVEAATKECVPHVDHPHRCAVHGLALLRADGSCGEVSR